MIEPRIARESQAPAMMSMMAVMKRAGSRAVRPGCIDL